MGAILDFLKGAMPQQAAQPQTQPTPATQMIGMPPSPTPAQPAVNPHFQRNQQFAQPGPYVTTLSPKEEQQFQSWVKQNKVPFDPSPTADYDMRGYWKDVASKGQNKTGINPVDKRLHFPDTYKTPYHQSFSSESKYATKDNPFVWQGETLIDKRTGKPVFQTQAK